MDRHNFLQSAITFLLSIIIILVGYEIILAQSGYPTPKNEYVNDYADVLELDDRKAIASQLAELRLEQGIQGTIVTIRSIEDYDTGDKTLEDFATNLFNTWGIGNKERNDGFLILVAIDDRRVRIELGKGYGNELNRDMQEVINRKMIPAFRNQDYSQGIYDGTISTIEGINRNYKPSAKPPVSIWTYVVAVVGVVVVLGTTMTLIILDSRKHLTKSRDSWTRKYRWSKRRRNGSWNSGGGGRGGRGGGSFGGGGSSGGGASGGW